MIVTAWLRAKFVDKSDEADASNALLSDIAKNSEQILWLRLNDLVKTKNDYSTGAHADDLLQQTIKIACEKTQSAELAKCAAEAELERMKSQIGTIIRKLSERMEQAAFQLAATEQRAITAEQRAIEAEASLKRVQAEILAKTMIKKLVPHVAVL